MWANDGITPTAENNDNYSEVVHSPNGNVGSFNISPLNSLIHKKKTHLTSKVGNNSVTKVAFIAVCKVGFQVQR